MPGGVGERVGSQSFPVRLLALAEAAQNVPSPQPLSEVDSEIAALRAKLAAMEEERDALGRRPKRQTVAQADASFVPDAHVQGSGGVGPLDAPLHLELREAMEFGDNSKVLELTSVLSDASVLMSELTGTMVP